MGDRTCSVSDCDRIAETRGWCRRHYNRWVKYGDAGSAAGGPRLQAERLCSIDACDRPANARGWCKMHWKRWRRTGSPLEIGSRWKQTDEERVMSQVVRGSECWEWQGLRNELGYGLTSINTQTKRAHRVVYEMLIGPIPDGLVLDHLCRNPPCCNPAHLEPVTQAENVRRGVSAQRRKEWAAERTHCKNGHEMTPENTYVWFRQPTWRRCRTCMALTDKRNKASRRARRAA